MAFPQPALFGWQPSTSGSMTTFTLQPLRYFWAPSPRRRRADFGIIQHGRDELHLVVSSDVPIKYDEGQEFRAMVLSAIANAGKVRIQYWNEYASSGAGGWATERFLLWQPEGLLFADGEADIYDLEIVLRSKGTPA